MSSFLTTWTMDGKRRTQLFILNDATNQFQTISWRSVHAKKDAREDVDARSLIPGQRFPECVRSSAVVNVMICEIVFKYMKTIFEYFSVWTFPWYINYSKRMVDRGGTGVPLVISLDMAPNRVKTSQLVKMNAIIEFLVWKNVSMQIFRF